MTYKVASPFIGCQPLTETSTTQKHALGTIVNGRDPDYGEGEFIYLLGVANTVVGSVVTYDPDTHLTTLCAVGGSIPRPIAVAMSANVASQYGWYQIAGCAAVKALNAMVPGAEVFMLAATPGSVDDAAVNGEQVLNAVVSTTTGTPGSGLGLIQINRPFLQGQVI